MAARDRLPTCSLPCARRRKPFVAMPCGRALPGAPLLALYRAERLRFRVALPEERAGALADDPAHGFEAALPTSNLSVGGLFLARTRLHHRIPLSSSYDDE